MATSTALIFVNKVLSLTGDLPALTTVVGSPNGIADRILNFANLTIDSISRKSDWPELRLDFTGSTDNTGYMTIPSSNNANFRGITYVSSGKHLLEAASASQMAKMVAENTIGGQAPRFYNRSQDINGSLQIQLYPVPASGDTVNLTAYVEPNVFTVLDTSTASFYDALVLYGTLAQLDIYDGQDRGYAIMFANELKQALTATFDGDGFRITPESYR